MNIPAKTISVSEAADLCRVGHGTVGYWIRSRKLHAQRAGRNYAIPVDELAYFLKTSGQQVPEELQAGDIPGPFFRSLIPCWHYWGESGSGHNCEGCAVYENRVDVCFTAKETNCINCPKGCCLKCRYYQEIFLPRIQFLDQIDFPAAVYRGLHIWGGNKRFADMCGFDRQDLPGMGIESLFHHESLERVLSNIRRRALGDPTVPKSYEVFLRKGEAGKMEASISVVPLREPSRTFLLLVDKLDDEVL